MATTTSSKETNTSEPRGNQVFLFDKNNYTWMIAGVALILIALFMMAGGKSEDPHKFNYNEVYSFTRITLAPIVMMIGFGIEIYAIMKKPASKN
jgi:hypothetical protein